MMTAGREASPQTYARTGGVHLFIIVAALSAEVFVRGSFDRAGDAAATAGNIIASETLFYNGATPRNTRPQIDHPTLYGG